MSEKERKPAPIKKYGPRWTRLANQLARSVVRIRACGPCNYPLLDGYVCRTCGGDDSRPLPVGATTPPGGSHE